MSTPGMAAAAVPFAEAWRPAMRIASFAACNVIQIPRLFEPDELVDITNKSDETKQLMRCVKAESSSIFGMCA